MTTPSIQLTPGFWFMIFSPVFNHNGWIRVAGVGSVTLLRSPSEQGPAGSKGMVGDGGSSGRDGKIGPPGLPGPPVGAATCTALYQYAFSKPCIGKGFSLCFLYVLGSHSGDGDSMLTRLSYVNSHIVDNLLFCSLEPYLLGRGVEK